MGSGLNPNCANEGKTDANLLRHIAAINSISEESWPEQLDGAATWLAGAGHKFAEPLGVSRSGS
jgi:cytolysin (calcineurin-like family phosphatase)